jgi:hypothetical protein
MSSDLFFVPGGDLLKKMGETKTSPSEDIFQKRKLGGGGGVGRKPAPVPVPEEEAIPFLPAIEEKPKEGPKVQLSNLKWSKETGEFNGTVGVSVEAIVPDDFKHMTKIEFKAIALTPDGKREVIDKQESHLQNGTASKEMTLFWPQYRTEGKVLDECQYIFTAKHRESKEV